MAEKKRVGGVPQEEVREERPERLVIKTQEGEEFQPVQRVGKSRFAVLRNIYRTISTLLITTGLGIYAWQKVVPGLVVKTAGSMPFQVPDWLYSLFFIVIQFGIVVVLALISCFLLPEVMFMPRDLRLVTKVFGIIPWTRGDWGFFFLLKPIEWPDSVVDVKVFTVDFNDINTSAAKGVPIRANATTLMRIVRPAAVVFGIENLKSVLCSVFEPVMETCLGKESYDYLQANKETISEDLLNQVRKKLSRLEREDFDLGIEVATFELKDTPIDDKQVRELYAARVGIEQRAMGRETQMQGDLNYLIGVAEGLMAKDAELNFQTALEAALRMAEKEAWEQGGALGARMLRRFATESGSDRQIEE